MGYMNHHAIVFTSFDEKYTKLAWSKAQELFDSRMVTEIKQSPVNVQISFAILPDGSKEGWGESKENDDKRNQFITFLKESEKQDKLYGDWVEVSFDEEGNKEIIS